MIKRPTVLVLGAGASHPVGYPVGSVLTEKIIKGYENLATIVSELIRGIPGDIARFGNDFLHSGQNSIDKFLDARRRGDTNHYRTIGKICIAAVLSQSESYDTLFKLDAENWYRFLLNKIDKSGFAGALDSKLSIITFNYDRSLEEFLYVALRTNYPTKGAEIVKFIQNLNIIHMYGDIGKLPWQNYLGGEGIPYDHNKNQLMLGEMQKGIKLIGEREQKDNSLRASELIKSAERVHFLGFAFDEDNLATLGIDYPTQPNNKFYGTSSGLGGVEEKRVKDTFTNGITLWNKKIHDYFHDYVEF